MMGAIYSQMVAMGVPVADLSPKISLPLKKTNLKAISIVSGSGSSSIKTFGVEAQLNGFNEMTELSPGQIKELSPVFVLSAPKHDWLSKSVAILLSRHFLSRNMSVTWVELSANRDFRLRYRTDVIIICNVVKSSTQYRLELLRDILAHNPGTLRIVVTAGWNGLDIKDAIHHHVSGTAHIVR